MMDAKLSYNFERLSTNERAVYLSLEIIIHTLYFIDKNVEIESPTHSPTLNFLTRSLAYPSAALYSQLPMVLYFSGPAKTQINLHQ